MAVYLGNNRVAFKGGTFNTDGTAINNQNKTITPTTSQQTITADSGYTGLGTVTVNRIPTNYIIPSGNKEITANGTGIDVTAYATVSVAVPTGGGGTTPTIQSLSITPSTSEQTFNSSSVDGYKPVTVAAIPAASSIYRIITNYSPEFTINEGTVSINLSGSFPVYCDSAGWITINSNHEVVNSEVTVEIIGSSQLPTMTLPTSAASGATSGYSSKATIGRSTSAQYINIPPGYNSTGAYYVISAVANGSTTGPTSLSGSSATITTGTNTITLTKTGVSTTPTVSAGYVSSATASTATVALTASVTVNPTPTASGATVTIPAGYYSSQTTKSVTTMTLPTSAAASATSEYTKKATISRSTSTQYINIAPGYNSAGGYYEISAVANGSATGPSSLSGTSATISTGTNTLTLTKTGITTTPTVSAGYISSATTSTATVTLTASVTTKAAATITPGTTNQTIASGTYLTGTQTISGDSNLVASNIVSGKSIFGVSGSVVLQNVYKGSSAPSSSTGSNGDIYLQS